ncbi:MAG: ubiquinol-cytochrome c reductase iron-sulfur subunit [Myxococcota bacterium]|nr:ubiquinol-cytochrome c reductase iron-sulfur subunit [Myxococcota bacterium]
MADNQETNRRTALKTLVVAGGAVGCGALAAPAVRLLLAPAGGGSVGGRWIRTLRLDALSDGEPKRASLIADHRDAWTLEKAVELGAVWLLRTGEGVRAWSVTCPHLGCAIDRGANAVGFNCPCHDSSFDPDGRRLSGPSPRDLDALATRVEDGFVLVEFRRFQQGIAEKVTVG